MGLPLGRRIDIGNSVGHNLSCLHVARGQIFHIEKVRSDAIAAGPGVPFKGRARAALIRIIAIPKQYSVRYLTLKPQ